MMRQLSSRNQRSKGGFRLKHVLQICLLLAICTWLLYQVKHSHDKKKAFEERITKVTSKANEKQPDPFNFGRKSLPLVDENDSMMGTRSKEEDNEEVLEEEGEQEHDMKHEESEDEEGKGDVDDRIDEQDQDKNDDENEQDEEFTTEEEKNGQVEEGDLFDNQEHEDTSQAAREENYKRENVSSAVAHDVNVTETETAKADARGSDKDKMENTEINDAKMENLGKATDGTVDGTKSNNNSTSGDLAPLNNISNVPLGENLSVPAAYLPVNSNSSDIIVEFYNPENESIDHPGSREDSNQKEVHSNMTISTLPMSDTELTGVLVANASDNQMGIRNNSTLDEIKSNRELPQNGTSSISIPDENISLANGASVKERMVEHNERFNTSETHMAEHNPATSAMNDNVTTAQGKPNDSAHNSVMAEEHEARNDLSTLPDISSEVKQGNDEASE